MPSSNSKTIELVGGATVTADCYRDFVLLRTNENSGLPLNSLGRAIFERNFEFVDEVIGTETEILLAVNEPITCKHWQQIEKLDFGKQVTVQCATHELLIHIDDQHEDWSEIEKHSKLSRTAYIERLLHCELSVAMTGFLPGFVYLTGLPKELHVPRKATPSTRTLAGTFAIGGKYAGVYSLPSAAGWNCIGTVSNRIFDASQLPPVALGVGDHVRLKRVEKEGVEDASSFVAHEASEHEYSKSALEHGTLVVETPGLLSLIQDGGRRGLAWYAIPRSGSMDATAAELGNAILGNDSSCPVIECHFVAPRIRFESEATICLTGADMSWILDGESLRRNRTIHVPEGSLLSGKSASDGCRAYVAIHGEIDASQTFGSSSTYVPAGFGGNQGKAFTKGDKLQWTRPASPMFPLQLKIENGETAASILMEPGPEFHWMNEGAHQTMFSTDFTINPQSNRMGARLDGPALSTDGKILEDSVPLLPGMIQLTPEGQLIVVLQDGQTTGGYPRVGYLNQKMVERLNQKRIGHPFRFEMAD